MVNNGAKLSVRSGAQLGSPFHLTRDLDVDRVKRWKFNYNECAGVVWDCFQHHKAIEGNETGFKLQSNPRSGHLHYPGQVVAGCRKGAWNLNVINSLISHLNWLIYYWLVRTFDMDLERKEEVQFMVRIFDWMRNTLLANGWIRMSLLLHPLFGFIE